MASNEFECVAKFPDVTSAHLARGVLEAAGIECELRHADLNSVIGLVPATEAMVELWCLSAHAARAREELARDEAPPTPRPAAPSMRSLLVPSLLAAAAILGWARVYQLSRPINPFAGSWDAAGQCFTQTLGTGVHEVCDADRNGIWERGSSSGRNGLSESWRDSDEDGNLELIIERPQSGALVLEAADTNRDGVRDELKTRLRDGRVVHSWRDEVSGLFAKTRLELHDGGAAMRSEDTNADGLDDVTFVERPDGVVIELRDRDGDGFMEWREGRHGERVLFRDSVRDDGMRETSAGN